MQQSAALTRRQRAQLAAHAGLLKKMDCLCHGLSFSSMPRLDMYIGGPTCRYLQHSTAYRAVLTASGGLEASHHGVHSDMRG